MSPNSHCADHSVHEASCAACAKAMIKREQMEAGSPWSLDLEDDARERRRQQEANKTWLAENPDSVSREDAQAMKEAALAHRSFGQAGVQDTEPNRAYFALAVANDLPPGL